MFEYLVLVKVCRARCNSILSISCLTLSNWHTVNNLAKTNKFAYLLCDVVEEWYIAAFFLKRHLHCPCAKDLVDG